MSHDGIVCVDDHRHCAIDLVRQPGVVLGSGRGVEGNFITSDFYNFEQGAAATVD